MRSITRSAVWFVAAVAMTIALPAAAQSFGVQCPTSTVTHPDTLTHPRNNSAEAAYSGPTYPAPTTDYTVGNTGPINGAIKCQQVGGGDGYASMADGTQTYMFSFGPLSGLANIANGQPGTTFPSEFNTVIADPTTLVPGYPQAVVAPATVYNGAIGQVGNNTDYTFNIYDISEGCSPALTTCTGGTANTVTVILNAAVPFKVGDSIVIGQGQGVDLAGYVGTFAVSAVGIANTVGLPGNFVFQYLQPASTGLAEVTASQDATASSVPVVNGHASYK